MRRMVVVENRSACPLNLQECFSTDQKSSFGQKKLVDPHGHIEFPASLFLNNNYYALRPSQILLFVAGVKLDVTLVSQTFVRYVKVIVDVNGDGQVVILGVPPKITDLCRFWGFGFLGREYRGRPEVLIASGRIET